MTLRSHTTYEESLRLKELGMEQQNPRIAPCWQFVWQGVTAANGDRTDDLCITPMHTADPELGSVVRALSRQEIVDELLRRGYAGSVAASFRRHADGDTDDPFNDLYEGLCVVLALDAPAIEHNTSHP